MKHLTHRAAPPFRYRWIVAHILLAAASGAYAQTAPTEQTPPPKAASNLGTIQITGEGDKLGTGLIEQEDTPKARSNVTRAAIEKETPSNNLFQTLNFQPGVNSYSYDGTGLFGGGLNVRGFDITQMGVTINGAPINDSGNFTVFPQEYVDLENTCQEFVTQGSTDIDAPHVGATGGNLGIVTCEPEDKRRIRFEQTLGQLDMYKTFIRFDSGKFGNDTSKFFISFSDADANKWKGPGDADRKHIDTGFRVDLDPGNHISGALLINRAMTDNLFTPTLSQLNQNGYYYDYYPTYSGQPAPGTGKVNLAVQNPAYYQLSTNPFENALLTVDGVFSLNDTTKLKVSPYYWYGYGTGGTQEKVLSESGFLNVATGKDTASENINGNSSMLVASSNVADTNRGGLNVNLTHSVDNHLLQAGLWYEYATQWQTAPAVAINANGTPVSQWLSSDYIIGPDGSPYEGRNWKTVNTEYQFFLQDSISLLNDKANLTLGVRTPHIERNFTNVASEAAGSGTTYNIVKDYSDILPQLSGRYNLSESSSLFANIAENFHAPSNVAFAPSSNNIVIVNGQATLASNIKPETSTDIDVGYRYQGSKFTLSGSVFAIDYRNREATTYDSQTDLSTYENAGSVKNDGFEIEAGTAPINGWSLYSSLTHNSSKIQDNFQVSATQALPTAGKEYPLTPSWMLAVATQYTNGPWYGELKAKYTGSQEATLMNDQEVPGYTKVDFSAGYKFGNFNSYFKNPTIRFNVDNLFNRQYRNPSGLQVNAQAYGTYTAVTAPTYYLGSPRFISLTFSTDISD